MNAKDSFFIFTDVISLGVISHMVRSGKSATRDVCALATALLTDHKW